MPKCRTCYNDIYWDKDQQTSSGRWIPVDGDGNPHRCETDFLIPCRSCGKEITFDTENRSINGKCIPMNADTLANHRCRSVQDD